MARAIDSGDDDELTAAVEQAESLVIAVQPAPGAPIVERFTRRSFALN
ncbi:MAG: hypothetical protein R2848_03530 [Thermomicrobiales bacterium]